MYVIVGSELNVGAKPAPVFNACIMFLWKKWSPPPGFLRSCYTPEKRKITDIKYSIWCSIRRFLFQNHTGKVTATLQGNHNILRYCVILISFAIITTIMPHKIEELVESRLRNWPLIRVRIQIFYKILYESWRHICVCQTKISWPTQSIVALT